MKSKKGSSPVFVLLAAFALGQCSRADETTVISTAEIPYVFKAKSLQGRVTEAMEQSKKGDGQPLDQLVDEFAADPDKVLKLLKPYWDDPSAQVQFGLIQAAEEAPQSDEALPILMHLLSKPEAGNDVAMSLYRTYSAAQLLERGGTVLKSALLRSVVVERGATYGYLLLSCYKDDPAIVQFLQKRRLTFKILPEGGGGIEELRRRVLYQKMMALDLALVELGDAPALERVSQSFASGEPGKVVALLHYLKFVNNKTVLAAAIAQLQNQAVAQEFHSETGDHVTSVRVCDVALPLLRSRFAVKGKTSGVLHDPTDRYSDAEILDASQKCLVVLNAQP